MSTLNRREFLGMTMAGICLRAGLAWPEEASGTKPERYNVLHLISDDLCNRLGCYGFPVKSPNIDGLAARGVKFDLAYCQYPLCNPSRASFMTGLRPDSTKVYVNKTHFRENVPGAATIPQSFQKAGYSVMRVGKIYHYGVPSQIGTDGLDDPASWEKVVNPKGRDVDDIGMVEVLQLGRDGKAETVTGRGLKNTGGTLSWLAAEGTDDEQTDGRGAAAAVELLEEFAKGSKPFYLAVGFYRPHTPFVAPKSYFGLYPRDKIELPVVPPNWKDLWPELSLASQKPESVAMDDDLKRQALQAYYASTTFMDAQTGHVLDALERLGLADKTIVIFHSDHGYHLGEKNLWQKQSVFDESARVPVIISVPGNKANGQVCRRPVELVSLHKTLTDLCDVSPASTVEGHSLRPLIENPKAAWEHAAFSQVERRGSRLGTFGKDKATRLAGIMGRSVRTERWRYTEWDEGRAGVELYDHEQDPQEMKNLAKDPGHAERAQEMKALLRTGGE